MKQVRNNKGFTLIEALIAMVVLTIGILSLYSMQTSALKGNSFAFNQTTAATLGMNQVETILAAPYDTATALNNGFDDNHDGTVDNAADDMLNDTNNDGIAGINNTVAGGVVTADYSTTTQDDQGTDYTIYWNIADNDPLQNAKTIRIIVTRTDLGATRPVALTYYKHGRF